MVFVAAQCAVREDKVVQRHINVVLPITANRANVQSAFPTVASAANMKSARMVFANRVAVSISRSTEKFVAATKSVRVIGKSAMVGALIFVKAVVSPTVGGDLLAARGLSVLRPIHTNVSSAVLFLSA